MFARFTVTATASMMLAACSGDHPSSPFLVRDSAGVTIVDSYAPSWEDGKGWTLSDEPLVSVGTADGRGEYLLHCVMAALRLPDGRIVLLNSGTDELRFYDSTGAHLYSAGQDGYGPGEFKNGFGMWLVSDTLVIDDPGQDRLSFFSTSGEYGRTLMLNREAGSYGVASLGVFSDGSILGRTLVIDINTVPETGMRFSRIDAVHRRHSRDGVVLDSLGVFFLKETLMDTGESSSALVVDAPFGTAASTIVFGEELYYGSSKQYEIQVFTNEGLLTRIYRRPVPNAPVTELDMELYRDDFVGDSDEFESWARRRVSDLEFPETKPAYGRIKLDALGNIWVDEYRWRRDDAARNWTVFDTAGRMLGVVEVPPRFAITDIGEDYLLGVWYDEMDVSYVRMYRLIKN